jgi:hypothetical protein
VALMRWLKTIYVFTFYVQYRCATSFGNQEWGEGNAVFAMALLQFLLLSELICDIASLTGHTPFVPSTLMMLFGSTAILILTYSLLVRKHQWLRYKSEFERYSRRRHFLASSGVGIVMAAALAGIVVVKKAVGAIH